MDDEFWLILFITVICIILEKAVAKGVFAIFPLMIFGLELISRTIRIFMYDFFLLSSLRFFQISAHLSHALFLELPS